MGKKHIPCQHCIDCERDPSDPDDSGATCLVTGKDRDGLKRVSWPICDDHLTMELEDGAVFNWVNA